MHIPEDLFYTKEHEWLRMEGNRGRVGITDYAQHSLGDIVFVELPPIGKEFKAGEAFGVVESVKSASDIYMPISGKVVAVNEEVVNSPQIINQDPYGQGWMIEIEPSNPEEIKELLDASGYKKLVEEG
ncbi:glycine cleavage system H protein [Thermanaeromonas toyohensis ToBE]|uniref:Glycine cleavage system H protein n=1 Tax=Thermanaeromonas toyohensis ToBE TaxID=698762 RepID=A0A1W1W1F5_9FIRM|nr:glycine cleavage system protein GcvH [Thermanaeromonas toyohensis]SMB99445.1 glycine cleavage system H protein [Thermanaeromonas toyohensis ToBE]